MKQMVKVVLTAAALVALAAPTMAAAANKLVVRDAANSYNVFTVNDAGQVGVGTDAPFADFQSTSTSTTNGYRGVTALQISAGNPGGVMNFMRAAGTPSSMAQPSDNNYIGVFSAFYYSTPLLAFDRSAQFGFRNDAASSSGSFPTKIMFITGDKAVNLKEGMAISSNQNVIVGNLGSAGTADMATSATSGFLYIPTVAGALTTCGSVPAGRTLTVGAAYPGHVPVWFDNTSSKICTCQGATLKCTAALN